MYTFQRIRPNKNPSMILNLRVMIVGTDTETYRMSIMKYRADSASPKLQGCHIMDYIIYILLIRQTLIYLW